MRCFHNPACFTSERRYKVFAERQTALRLVPRFKTVFAQQRSVQCSPRAAASASLEGSQPCAASCFSQPHPRCRPYPTAQASAIWSAMFAAHSPTPCRHAKPSTLRYLAALVGVPMFRKPQHTSTSSPSHPTAQACPLDAPHALAILPSPAPNHPPVGRALGSLPRFRPNRRASHKTCFRLARATYSFLYDGLMMA